MPARDADPTRAPDPGTDPPVADHRHDDLPGEPGSGPDDPATARIRALLHQPDPWWERLGGHLAAVGIARSERPVPARAVVVVALAVGLGVVAFARWGGGGAAVDAVQVLPRAAGAAAPGSVSGVADTGAAPTSEVAAVVAAGGPGGTSPEHLSVHAAGAVAQPGIHQVPADARVADLIAVAGGLSADADPDRINLAAPLHDGERVYVPRRGETSVPQVVAGGGADPSGSGGGGETPDGGVSSPGSGPVGLVDLNTADAAALDALPGVGPATAAAIIEHRTQHGPFTSVAELQDVAGIGPARFERLRDLVRV